MNKQDPLQEIVPPPGAPARYTQKPLPPYRYVPGLHPHPVAHPDGHSFNPTGAHPAADPWVPPERWRESLDYLFGVDLYNNAYWWEAHEAWEGLWQQTDKSSPQGRFLQGLIQVSAAHLKRHVGEAEGMQRLLRRALEHLNAACAGLPAGACYMGVDYTSFMENVEGYFAGRREQFPFIRLHDEA